MANQPKKASSDSSRTQIVVAVIGLVGVVIAAGFANWDKIIDKNPPPTQTAGKSSLPKPNTVAPSGGTSLECSSEALRNQLLHAGSDKREFIKTSARTMRQRFNLRDFNCVSGLATVLLEVDQDNGHGLYFLGEALRANAKQDSTQANILRGQMRSFFFRYLDNESKLALGNRDGNAAACYERENGYCKERTAWINHLMANDYYQQAQDTADTEIKMHHLQRALGFVDNDLKFGGFDEILPSRALKHKIQEELESLTHRSSGTARKRATP